MSVADQILAMTDADLARFHANAVQVHAVGSGPRFQQAAELLPLLDAEISARNARKPAKKLTKAAAARQQKADEAARAAEAAEHAEEEAAEAANGVEALDA